MKVQPRSSDPSAPECNSRVGGIRASRWWPRLGLLGVAALGILPGGCDDAPPTAPSTLRLDGVVFRGDMDVRESFPVQLGFRLVARNAGDVDVHVVTDGCRLGALAYRNPGRIGDPVWNGRPAGACRASPAPLTLPAGDSVILRQDYSAADVLGDSLPDGRYYFTASLGSVSLAGSENVRGEIEVAAGDAVLDVPRSEFRQRLMLSVPGGS